MVKLTIKTGVDGLEITFEPGDDREVRKEFVAMIDGVVGIFRELITDGGDE